MNRKEAMRALVEGKKITLNIWNKSTFLHIWNNSTFLHMPGNFVIDEVGVGAIHLLVAIDTWELYTEPKKKVTKWLWTSNTGKDPRTGPGIRMIFGYTSQFFTEQERPEEYPIKLEYTATEFEE